MRAFPLTALAACFVFSAHAAEGQGVFKSTPAAPENASKSLALIRLSDLPEQSLRFARISGDPVTVVDVRYAQPEVAADRGLPSVPPLKTVGPVELGNGWRLGHHGPEYVRVNDRVVRGVVANAAGAELLLTLADGERLTLPADAAIYVGDYKILWTPVPPSEKSLLQLACFCTCDCGDAGKLSVRIDCGAPCVSAGDQCGGLDGDERHAPTPCDATVDGKLQRGKLQNCQELAVMRSSDSKS